MASCGGHRRSPGMPTPTQNNLRNRVMRRRSPFRGRAARGPARPAGVLRAADPRAAHLPPRPLVHGGRASPRRLLLFAPSSGSCRVAPPSEKHYISRHRRCGGSSGRGLRGTTAGHRLACSARRLSRTTSSPFLFGWRAGAGPAVAPDAGRSTAPTPPPSQAPRTTAGLAQLCLTVARLPARVLSGP